MKDKKRFEILWKVIKKVYDENPKLQKFIDALIAEVWAEESVSPKQVCFYFDFLLVSLS